MDYDALVAAGTGSNGSIIADITISEDTNTIVINDLDINAVGGTYDIHINGVATQNAFVNLKVNSIAAANHDIQQRLSQATRTTNGVLAVSSSVSFGSTAMFVVYSGGLDIDVSLSLHTGNVTASGRCSSLRSGGQRLCASGLSITGQSIGNITSLTFTTTANSSEFKAGTNIKITKRG